eukprot:RCo041433
MSTFRTLDSPGTSSSSSSSSSCSCSESTGPSARWQEVDCNGPSPSPRSGHTVIEHQGCLIVHAGYLEGMGPSAELSNDTYAFSFEDRRWRSLLCDGDIPPKVFGHTAILLGESMVVYGGQDFVRTQGVVSSLCLAAGPNGRYCWTTMVHPSNPYSPRPRWGHSAVSFGGEMIVFGGSTLHPSFPVLDDTMKFSVTSGWEPLCTTGTPPSARRRHSAVQHRHRMWVFGGRSSEDLFNDLYTLDLHTLVWTQIQPAVPVPLSLPLGKSGPKVPAKRTGHTACVAAHGTVMIIFGGLWLETKGGTGVSAVLNDVWALDLEQLRWIPLPADPEAAVSPQNALGDGSITPPAERSTYFSEGDPTRRDNRGGAPAWRSMGIAAEQKGVVWIHGGRDKARPFGDMFQLFITGTPAPTLLTLVAEYALRYQIL